MQALIDVEPLTARIVHFLGKSAANASLDCRRMDRFIVKAEFVSGRPSKVLSNALLILALQRRPGSHVTVGGVDAVCRGAGQLGGLSILTSRCGLSKACGSEGICRSRNKWNQTGAGAIAARKVFLVYEKPASIKLQIDATRALE